MDGVASASHSALLESEGAQEPLILEGQAVVRVLRQLRDGDVAPAAVQAWASFARRGYVEGASGPVRPIGIEYEGDSEDAIAEAISRLDELGDDIDGELALGELDDLLELLNQSGPRAERD